MTDTEEQQHQDNFSHHDDAAASSPMAVVDLSEQQEDNVKNLEEQTIHEAQPEHTHPLTIFQTQMMNMTVSAVGVPELKLRVEYILGIILLVMTVIAVVLTLVWLTFFPFSSALMAIAILWIGSTIQLYGIAHIFAKLKVEREQEKMTSKFSRGLFRFHTLTFAVFNLCLILINSFSYIMNAAFARRQLRSYSDNNVYCYDGSADACLQNLRNQVYEYTRMAFVPWFVIPLGITGAFLVIHWLYAHKRDHFKPFYVHLVLYVFINLVVYMGWAFPVYFVTYFDYTPWFLWVLLPSTMLIFIHLLFFKMQTGFTMSICGVTLSATRNMQ